MNTTNINLPEDAELDSLANAFIAAGEAYRAAYIKHFKSQGNDAVIWVRNTETGRFVVFTRGEYSSDLMNFISKIR